MTEGNNLSERELEILRLVATGASNKEIAQRLQISMNTVKVHLRNILSKTATLSRTEATLYAIEHGIVAAPGKQPAAVPTSFWVRHRTEFIRLGTTLLVGLLIILVWNLTHPVEQPPEAAPLPALPFIVTATSPPLWQVQAELPEPLASMAAVPFENHIYLVGGQSDQGTLDSVAIYDPSDRTWSQGHPKPTPTSHDHAVLISERILIPGGLTAAGVPTDLFEAYDPRHDTWQSLAELPVALADYGLAVHEGQMYLFGGWDGTQVSSKVYQYNPATGEWMLVSELPSARTAPAVVENGGKIYMLGGTDPDGQILQDIWVYIPGRDRNGEEAWQQLTDLPTQLSGIQAVSLLNTIFVLGRAPGDPSARLIQLALDTLTWTTLETAPHPLAVDAGFTTLQNSIFVMGGRQGETLMSGSQSVQGVFTINIPAVTK